MVARSPGGPAGVRELEERVDCARAEWGAEQIAGIFKMGMARTLSLMHVGGAGRPAARARPVPYQGGHRRVLRWPGAAAGLLSCG